MSLDALTAVVGEPGRGWEQYPRLFDAYACEEAAFELRRLLANEPANLSTLDLAALGTVGDGRQDVGTDDLFGFSTTGNGTRDVDLSPLRAQALAELTRRGQAQVPWEAWAAMVWLGVPDRDAGVALVARLVATKQPGAVPALVVALERGGEQGRLAAKALGALGDVRAVPALEGVVLRGKYARYREVVDAAREALAALKPGATMAPG